MFIDNILIIVEHYKYIVIFPIMIIEGPIISIISGFLVYLGFLNVFLVYPLLVAGDLIGDSLYYGIGRYFSQVGWIRKVGTYLGYTEKSEEYLKAHFEKHLVKTLLIAKVSHGVGMTVQITAGMAKVKFLKYFSIELFATIPKILILLIIGYYLGGSYLKINGYFHLFALTTLTIFVGAILYLLLRKYAKKFEGLR